MEEDSENMCCLYAKVIYGFDIFVVDGKRQVN